MNLESTNLGWLSRVRKNQAAIERFVKFRLLPKIWDKQVRRTAHYQEWISELMNYPRIMELSLTLELLELKGVERILDISSPKLLALYLALETSSHMHISDIESYFISDFEIYRKKFKKHYEIEVFDAQKIPHKNNTFDRIFSISVLEHVPGAGDTQILREIQRILKPGGMAVITLPAWHVFMEEWQKEKCFYWPTEKNGKGEFFYQRRYDVQAIRKRMLIEGLEISQIIFVAEHPVEQPRLDHNGMLLHNAYLAADQASAKRSKLPLQKYQVYKKFSSKYHYLTTKANDPNIRQVAVQLVKK